jgi:hypothetical protein
MALFCIFLPKKQMKQHKRKRNKANYCSSWASNWSIICRLNFIIQNSLSSFVAKILMAALLFSLSCTMKIVCFPGVSCIKFGISGPLKIQLKNIGATCKTLNKCCKNLLLYSDYNLTWKHSTWSKSIWTFTMLFLK